MCKPWWRHQMETFSALLAICVGTSRASGEFPAQRPVTRSFDVFFDLRLNKWLSKQPWGSRFETPSSPLWRHCNAGQYCGCWCTGPFLVFHEERFQLPAPSQYCEMSENVYFHVPCNKSKTARFGCKLCDGNSEQCLVMERRQYINV